MSMVQRKEKIDNSSCFPVKVKVLFCSWKTPVFKALTFSPRPLLILTPRAKNFHRTSYMMTVRLKYRASAPKDLLSMSSSGVNILNLNQVSWELQFRLVFLEKCDVSQHLFLCPSWCLNFKVTVSRLGHMPIKASSKTQAALFNCLLSFIAQHSINNHQHFNQHREYIRTSVLVFRVRAGII